VEWVARDDGHGLEIEGISGQMMRLFSSRRESITADVRARAAQFEQQYGRAPSPRELAHLAQASNFTTRNPKHGALDVAQAHAGWADKLARTLGVSLASVAPSVWHAATGRAAAHARGADGASLTEVELARAAQKAVALAQQEKSAWNRLRDRRVRAGQALPRRTRCCRRSRDRGGSYRRTQPCQPPARGMRRESSVPKSRDPVRAWRDKRRLASSVGHAGRMSWRLAVRA
jgi:TrwC relaxase